MNQQNIEETPAHAPQMSPRLQDYLDALRTVSTQAGLCAVSCFGTDRLTRTAQLALDTQDMANFALAVVARCSPVNDLVAATAARLFEQTAIEAERWEKYHDPCKALAFAARRAAHESRRMASS